MIDVSRVEIYGGTERLRTRLRTLFTTPQGTVAFDRNFGVDYGILDLPMTAARARIAVEFREKQARYLPEIEDMQVSFSGDLESGEIFPKVVIA